MHVLVGVEKECLVFDRELRPIDLEIENLPKEYTVDFANHQLELVTSPKRSGLEVAVNISELLNHEYFEGKYIWPLSTPMSENKNVLHNKLDKQYRNSLAVKYGIEKMLYSGIHFNYSNSVLQTEEEYFKLIQNIWEYMPIIMQFTSYSPYAHHQFEGLEQIGKNYGFKDSISLRGSDRYGYANEGGVSLDFQSLSAFKKSKLEAISAGGLIDEREIYSKLRLKKAENSNYIELRFLDLNPYLPEGINEETLVLIESTLNYLSCKTNDQFNYRQAARQVEKVALHGRNREMPLIIDNRQASLYKHTINLLDKLIGESNANTYNKYLRAIKQKYINQQLDIDIMCKTIDESNQSLQQFGLDNIHINEKFKTLYQHLDMELSTKLIMNKAKNRGYQVSVESETNNILKISSATHSEYLIQGTKTNLDGFANVLLVDDKYMTKKVLAENRLCVPVGVKLRKGEEINYFPDHKVVIKPLDTNFGLGITVCDGSDREKVIAGCQHAFEYSNEILIEKYIEGQEFRFLVIGDVVESIITRKNANVIGDGKLTIKQLIAKKNTSPLRGQGYKTPLEKIIIDDDLNRVINRQGYNLDSIPKLSVEVLLRDSSNVSQGGDSHEVFDIISDSYKLIAAKAAKILGLKICGIDMIIDFESGDYSIIEGNYNPAIHMHMYPYKGRGRDVASKVLDLLFKNEN